MNLHEVYAALAPLVLAGGDPKGAARRLFHRPPTATTRSGWRPTRRARPASERRSSRRSSRSRGARSFARTGRSSGRASASTTFGRARQPNRWSFAT